MADRVGITHRLVAYVVSEDHVLSLCVCPACGERFYMDVDAGGMDFWGYPGFDGDPEDVVYGIHCEACLKQAGRVTGEEELTECMRNGEWEFAESTINEIVAMKQGGRIKWDS